MDAMENLKSLKSSRMTQEISGEAASRFCEDFEFVESKLINLDQLLEESQDGAEEGNESPTRLRQMFPRTSGEIRVLLS